MSMILVNWTKNSQQKLCVNNLLAILAMNFHRIRFNG